jgi:DNA recombination protein RmuC
MNEVLLWIILSIAAVTAILVVVLLIRAAKASQGVGREVREELRNSREEARSAARELREEVAGGLKSTNEVLAKTMEGLGKLQQTQLEGMTKQLTELINSNQAALDRVRLTFDSRVKELQEGNEKKLEEMRKTVDEKLHDTLEKRLGESFKVVSERLEAVHQGLGEMQHLATGVGDLKRVLVNVKARGTWAEVQLGAILEQILTQDQFDKNVRVKPDSGESVEYAVRLPGPKDDSGACVWLPIDSKFPQEDYLRLQEASEKADPGAVQAAADALARTVRAAAKDIHDKYISPPGTTDFAIMFLATEGLYAEVLRQPALVDDLQHRYRVVVAGPTTIAAILSSLRMGFQTLAIEQRAAEVWRVLGAIKTEFGKFGDVLDRVKRHIDLAGQTIEKTGVRSRAIERKLRSVEKLPEPEALEILALPTANEEDNGEDQVVDEAPTEPKQE